MSFQHRFVQGLGVEKRMHRPNLLGHILLAITLLVLGTQAAQAVVQTCSGGALSRGDISSPPDLLVTGECSVAMGVDSYFGNVNILAGGILLFREDNANAIDSNTDFWASSIIIENAGKLYAYGDDNYHAFGFRGGVLTIHLYGKNEAEGKPDQQNQGALCQSPLGAPGPGKTPAPCGIPQATWDSNGASKFDLPGLDAQGNHISDYFYQYGPLHGDGKCTDGSVFKVVNGTGACNTSTGKVGYFGNKVLAVSYGGSLYLTGYKGATYEPAQDRDPLSSGRSWRRLADGRSLASGATFLFMQYDHALDDALTNLGWKPNDEIVVTTTDYLPGHSERLKVSTIGSSAADGLVRVDFNALDNPTGKTGVQWPHNGVRYGGPKDAADKQWTSRLPDRLKKPDPLKPEKGNLDPNLLNSGAETRAAVALLSRSIKIVSEGDVAGVPFGYHGYADYGDKKPPDPHYSYGGHLVVRQGFTAVQVQGVEFKQMGQGGRLGHYPVHFHMARQTPGRGPYDPAKGTYVKDSSINESMTRWIVLHSTLGVTVQRNVGYKSIGHGFYLEDGTETDNKFYSNIGVFARAAVDNPQNPRKVPGILADNTGIFGTKDDKTPGFPYRSDIEYPTVFWITNGWNDFQGNMAAGAGACGAAYWFVPVSNSDMVEISATPQHMNWSDLGHAGLQTAGMAGTTPLKTFYMNYATSTMHSFQTTGDAPPCHGILAFGAPPRADGGPVLRAVRSTAPPATRKYKDPAKPLEGTQPDNLNDHYYPHGVGGQRYATKCPGDETKGYGCSSVKARCDAGQRDNCAVTVLDHFTSSFHWAESTISAIWLRPQWYLVTNSVISDVQNGGLTFVTGGDYTHSSVIPGFWALARNTIFIGNTNPNPDPNKPETSKYAYTGNAGPFNAVSQLKCDPPVKNYCLKAEEGISMPMGGFFTNQRLSNIYDGPSYQDSNAYLDITIADCPIWKTETGQGCMYGSQVNYLRLRRTPLAAPPDTGKLIGDCQQPNFAYLPNAAIGWKQPNGFYYPPAFHSRNLFFDNVDLRHYVIDPLFMDGKYVTDDAAVSQQYCTAAKLIFQDWTAIDRQTELTDDDGTLTGLSSNNTAQETVSVNDDTFFNAPVEAPECASAIGPNAAPINACKSPDKSSPPQTAKTSPYEFVSTVVYRTPVIGGGVWDKDCSSPNCYGVPLYRQSLTKQEMTRWNLDCSQAGDKTQDKCRWPFIRMAGAAISQRQTMTMNNGVYYLDTTVSGDRQKIEPFSNAAPEPNCKDGANRGEPRCIRRSYNVFQEGQTYYVFFVYARKTTVQTYQIYVGENFDPKRGFRTGRMSISNLGFNPAYPTSGITPDYNSVKTDGILTVKINFANQTELEPTSQANFENLCQPRRFCKLSTDPMTKKTQCVSAVEDNDPLLSPYRKQGWKPGDKLNATLKDDISAACATWAAKDLDCPKAGCFGFSFTLPKGFETGLYKRPDPTPFVVTTQFSTQFPAPGPAPDDKPGGQCYYNPANAPVGSACPSP